MKFKSSWHVDHVDPCGDNQAHNLVPACAPCNVAKSNHSIEQLRATLARKVDGCPRFTDEQIVYLHRVGVHLPPLPHYVFWFEKDEAEQARQRHANSTGASFAQQNERLRAEVERYQEISRQIDVRVGIERASDDPNSGIVVRDKEGRVNSVGPERDVISEARDFARRRN